MNSNLHYFQEPQLKFAYGQTTEDSRDGLTLFGPFQKAQGMMRVGVVSTQAGLLNYNFFVNKINRPIFSKSLGRPFFPGFTSVFGLEWPKNPSASLLIDESSIEKLVNEENLKKRTYGLVSLYLNSITTYIDNEETPIDIWFIVIPYQVWLKCRPKSPTKQTEFSKKSIKDTQRGMLSLFKNDVLKEFVKMLEYDSDFHDQLKARAIFCKIQSPIQIALESTLLFKVKDGSDDYSTEMQAHLAWTQSSAVFYKLGYLPWKLDSIRSGVCYVGLVFKKLQDNSQKKGFACSAAQMFLDSGDGTVFRGNIGPWMSQDEKTFHLDRKSARSLLDIALTSYKANHGDYPKELFIHGKAAFNEEEWAGFLDAKSVSTETKLVGVVINQTDKFRLFKNSSDSENNYGIMRGMGLVINATTGYLWTRGFIPKTMTSNHMEVANPLRITVAKGQCDIYTVMRDILCLTKLNYNACIYGDGIPVTLRFSDKIGNILTAIPNVNWAAKQFKYYI